MSPPISTAIVVSAVTVIITTPAVVAIAVSAVSAVIIPVVIAPVAAPVPVAPVVSRTSVVTSASVIATAIPDNYLVVPVPEGSILRTVIIKMAPWITFVHNNFVTIVQIIVAAAAGQ